MSDYNEWAGTAMARLEQSGYGSDHLTDEEKRQRNLASAQVWATLTLAAAVHELAEAWREERE